MYPVAMKIPVLMYFMGTHTKSENQYIQWAKSIDSKRSTTQIKESF